MKLQSALWNKVFTEDEIKKLKSAIGGDTVIIPAISRVIEYMIETQERPTASSEIDSAWPIRRAHQDGRQFQLMLLKELLKEE